MAIEHLLVSAHSAWEL